MTSCDFGGMRNIHTENQSEMEAWEAMVDYSKLSDMDLKIHQRHVAANKVNIFSKFLLTQAWKKKMKSFFKILSNHRLENYFKTKMFTK